MPESKGPNSLNIHRSYDPLILLRLMGMTALYLQVAVLIGADSKGHATLSCSTCSLNIGSLSIKFHGGASWLYNLFSDYISDQLKASIQGQVIAIAREQSLFTSALISI